MLKKTLILLFILISFLSFVIVRRAQKKTNSYNLILISVDTLRADSMGVYGYNKNTTPNIDTWAKNAMVFNNMTTQVPTTYPSFAMLMTNISSFQSKIFSNSVGDDGISNFLVPINNKTTTLAQILKKNGYSTAAFINTDSLDGGLTNMDKGFDVYKNYDKASNENQESENVYKSLVNINGALNWLSKNENKKFFLWVHLMEPHSPYLPIKEFQCRFNLKYCSIIEKRGLSDLEKEREKLKGCREDPLPPDKVELFKTIYDGGIATGDKLIKKIFDKIKSTGIDKKTIVVFYGDHGEGFDHNFYFFHNYELYDSFVKIPFIIKAPDLAYGKNSQPIQNTQILPTLLELLGIDYNKSHIKSPSFTSLLNKNNLFKSYNSPKYRYFVNDNLTKYGIQKDKFKFIYSLKEHACLYGGWDEELYNLESDPEELNNIADSEVKVAKELKMELLAYLAQYGLPRPLKETMGDGGKTIDRETIEKLKSLGY